MVWSSPLQLAKEFLEVVKLPGDMGIVDAVPAGPEHEPTDRRGHWLFWLSRLGCPDSLSLRLGGPRQLSVDYTRLLRLVSVKLLGLQWARGLWP